MIIKNEARRSAVWHIRSARLSLRIGDAECALREVTRFLEKSRESGIHSAGMFLIAVDALIASQRYDEARGFARVGLLSWPHLTGFAARLARLDLLQGETRQSIWGARRMLLDMPYMQCYLLEILADGYREMGQFTDAIRVYRQLLAEYGDTHDNRETLLARMGEVCYGIGYHDEGLRYLEMIQRPSMVLRGKLLHGTGRLIEALDIYDMILIYCGLVSSRDENISTAVPLFFPDCCDECDNIDEDILLDLSLKRIDALERLGRVSSLEKLGRWEIANPSEDAQVRIAIARALVKRGRSTLAVQLVRKDRHHPAHRRVVTGIILSAAEIAGRNNLADICVKRLVRHRGTVLRAERDSVFGRLMRKGRSYYAENGSGMKNDPPRDVPDTSISFPASPLTKLVHHACSALEQAVQNNVGAEEYEIHLSRCRGVLDQEKQQEYSSR